MMKIMGYEGITGLVVEVFSNKGNRKELCVLCASALSKSCCLKLPIRLMRTAVFVGAGAGGFVKKMKVRD